MKNICDHDDALSFQIIAEELCDAPKLKYVEPDIAIARTIYMYYFEGKSLKQIEKELYGSKALNGFISKSLLNMNGLSSDKCGAFKYESPDKIIPILLNSGKPACIRAARYLLRLLETETSDIS